MNAKETFFLTFSDLQKFCLQTIDELQPKIFERNQAALNSIQANTESFSSKTTEKVIEAADIQKKLDVTHMILNNVEQIIADFNRGSENLTKMIPNSFESTLFLLPKLTNSNFLQRIEKSMEELYGRETLEEIKKFPHLNTEALDQATTLKATNVFIREYVYILQKMYSPQTNNSAQVKEVATSNGSSNSSPIKGSKDSSNDVSEQKDSADSVEIKAQEIKPPIVNSCASIEEEKVNTQDSAIQKNTIETEQNWDHLKITAIKGINLEPLKNYKKLQETLLATGQKYTDPDFPPTLDSITSNISTFADASKIVWKRIPELFPNQKLTIADDTIGPDDIHQGNLKDCYLLSTLGVLSEQKHYIQRLFETKEVSPTGCYSLWLCDSGEWKNVIIDDYIPCIFKNNKLKPCFAMVKNNHLWVCLIEKAFAKIHGNYVNLENGYQMEAYHVLTGAPVRRYKQRDNKSISIEQFWSFLTKSLEQKFVITSSCRDDEPALSNDAMGLVSHHAYAIAEAREAQLPDGTTERLVKLRNPWGYREWKGKWADTSLCWTPELMKMLNYKPNKNDGVFWMNIEDLDKHFYQSFTCKVHSNYGFHFIRLGEKKKQNFFVAKMRLKNAGSMYLGVQQKVRRHFPKGSGYEYSYVRMFVARLKDDKIISVVQGTHDIGQSSGLDINLSKGQFLIFIEVDWVQDMYHKINLTAYSSEQVYLSEEPIEKYDISSLYKEILRTHIVNKKDHRYQTVQYSHEGKKVQIWKYEVRRFGLGVILYSNLEKDLVLHSSLDIKSKNMHLEILQGGGSITDICVPSGEERMVVFRADKVLKTYKDYSFNSEETYKIQKTSSEEKIMSIEA